MGMIFPPYINSNLKLFGEERVFLLLKNIDFPKDYFIFHSLNILDHISKKEGEVDFLILSPSGILIVEVKGAKKIIVNNGFWKYSTDKFEYESAESPFQQAKSNYYSIIKNIEKIFPEMSNLKKISGYGVIFPNLIFTIKSVEWCDDIILDENNLDKMESYIENLYKYWRTKSDNNPFYLSSKTINKLKDYLRPSFERFESLKSFISTTSKLIDEVTEEQYSILDGLSEYPRIIVKGLAGTGKTFLAMEQSRRKSFENKKVLFLCFNRLLMQNLYNQITKDRNISIYNIDKFIYEMLVNNNVKNKFLTIEEMRRFLISNINFLTVPEFEYLIIDEAQDILSNQFMTMFNKLLSGGIEEGSWSFFLDDYVQDELFAKKEELNNIINDLKNNSIVYNLSINCRNSRFLGDKMKDYTSLPIPKFFKYVGNKNNLQIIYTTSDSFVAHISDIIMQLLKDGITPNLITILSPIKNFEFLKKVYPNVRNTLETFIDLSNFSADIKKERFYIVRNRCISYSTIQAFKGLENEIIILCNINNVDSIYDKAILYTGMSRTKSKLIIFIDETFNKKIN